MNLDLFDREPGLPGWLSPDWLRGRLLSFWHSITWRHRGDRRLADRDKQPYRLEGTLAER